MSDEVIQVRVMEKGEWPAYKEIFKKVFKEWDGNQRPQIVIIASDESGEDIGFATFILQNVDTAYIQYVGCIKTKRGRKMWRVLERAMKVIKDNFKCQYFCIRIPRSNQQALVIALMNNFIIRGMVLDYVDLVKELKDA